jgi:hypothetical protein
MKALPRITTFAWVPAFARGFVRDLRLRWAFEEVGQTYAVDLIRDGKTAEHRRAQPFGQVPTGTARSRCSSRARSCCTSPNAPDG